MKINKLILLSATLFLISNNSLSDECVVVSKFVSHPSLDKVERGIGDYLKKNNIKAIFKDANANMVNAVQIANYFYASNCRVAIGIATPPAQALYNALPQDKSMIFSSITDPKNAGIKNDKKVTGVVNCMDPKEYLGLIRALFPNSKKIGLIYSGSELNSKKLVESIKLTKDFVIYDKSIYNLSQLSSAFLSIADKIDVLLLIQDNIVATASENLILLADNKNIPVVGSYSESMDQGAVASISYDEYKIGVQSAEMAKKILHDKVDAGSIEIENPKFKEIIISKSKAKKFDIKLDKNILGIFTKIVD